MNTNSVTTRRDWFARLIVEQVQAELAEALPASASVVHRCSMQNMHLVSEIRRNIRDTIG